jgi:alkylated DNA repair dioxygenase AlkB
MSGFESFLDGDVLLDRGYIARHQADSLLQVFQQAIDWQQETLFLYGRSVLVPRLVAWYGDEQAAYRYSGRSHIPLPWTKELLHLREMLEDRLQVEFNAVLLNLYRHGNDSMSWHADDEAELGEKPLIASISLGAERDFQLRHRNAPGLKISISLPHGSLLVMQNGCQSNWQHQLPKRKRCKEARVNLTFRKIIS